MTDYLTALSWLFVYAIGAILAAFLLLRFGGDEMRVRDEFTGKPTTRLGGLGSFYAAIWPLWPVIAGVGLYAAIYFAPIIVPAFLIGRHVLAKAVRRAKGDPLQIGRRGHA